MLAGLLSSCAMFQSSMVDDVSSTAMTQDIVIQWSTDLDSRNPADSFGFSRPGFDEKQQVIVVGARDARAHVYSLSGSEIFRVPLQKSSDSGVAFLSNGVAVLGDSDGILYGIDTQQGTLLWQLELSGPFTGIPVVVGDDVLVQTLDNRVYRISAAGEKRWSFSAPTAGLGMYLTPSPLVQGEYAYLVFSNGDAVAVNVNTGDLLWRKQLLLNNDAAVLNEIKAPQAAPILLKQLSMGDHQAKNVVLFSFYQGDLVALDAGDGRRLFSYSLSIKSTPYVQGDSMFTADETGTLQALNTHTGQKQWQLNLSKQELVGPVFYANMLWLADAAGNVFKVNLQGQLQASENLPGEITRALTVTSRGVLARTNLGGLYLLK